MKKVLKRFINIWKLDFLVKFFSGEEKDNKTTIWFWIISNIVLTLLLIIPLVFSLIGASDEIISSIEENVPNGALITVVDGQLTTQNIAEPLFREINLNNNNINYKEKMAIIIDTKKGAYDITSLDEYVQGILILRDRVYIKNNARINQLIFKDVPNFSFSKENIIAFVNRYFVFPFAIFLIIFVGGMVLFYFIFLRLISAFWWAFMLFVVMRIFDVEEKYMTAYKAVLNFYFIPTIVVFILGLAGFTVPFVTTIIFLAIFIANLIWLKRQFERDSIKGVLDDSKEKVENITIAQTKE